MKLKIKIFKFLIKIKFMNNIIMKIKILTIKNNFKFKKYKILSNKLKIMKKKQENLKL